MIPRSVVSLVLATVLGSAAVAAQSPAPAAPAAPAAPTAVPWKGDPYTLPTDALTGEPLGPIEKQVRVEVEGREFRFANAENAKKFEADPKAHVAAVDERIVRDQKPFYPLETCLVSGDPLGAGAVDVVHKNRLVRLSSADHAAKLLADPATHVAKLDAAVIAKQKPAYVSKTCPISADALGGEMGEPVDYVIANRLLRLCCKGCRKDLEKDPLKYLSTPDRKNETEAAPEAPKAPKSKEPKPPSSP